MSQVSKEEPAAFDTYRLLVGRNLVVARSAAGFTQQALARRSRVSRATIAQLESGAGDPRLSTLEMLANALHVSPLQLVLGPREMYALQRLLNGDHAMAMFRALEVSERPFVSIDIADRARDLATSAGAAIGAALGASTQQSNGGSIGAALGYLLERSQKHRQD